MIIVLDVSGAIEMLLKKEKNENYKNELQNASWVIAPDLYVSELSNVLWKYYKAKAISHNECVQYGEDGIEMIDDFVDSRDIWKEAFAEGIKNNHSIYDMYYAVIARRNDAKLITNDGKLAEICNKLGIDNCY